MNEPIDLTSTELAVLRRLVEQYANAVDRGDMELFADVFAEDAVLVTPSGEVRGRERLRGIPPQLSRYRATMHLIGNHHAEMVGPDEAVGATHCEARHVYERDDAERVHVMFICYHDRYRRTEGRWRIAERRLELLWDEDHPLRT